MLLQHSPATSSVSKCCPMHEPCFAQINSVHQLLPHYCDKTPDKGNFKKGGFISALSLGVQSVDG